MITGGDFFPVGMGKRFFPTRMRREFFFARREREILVIPVTGNGQGLELDICCGDGDNNPLAAPPHCYPYKIPLVFL